jgi:FkbM family methyltransferase
MHVSWRKRISRLIRGDIRARIMGTYGDGILARTKNGSLIVDPRDFNVSRSLLTHGSYDWREIQWLARILDEQSSIVFVGAHIGSLLIPLARQSGSHRVIAFEPSPRNHHMLKLNVLLNELDSVEIHQIAAGDGEGTVGFTENKINSGNSRVSQIGEVQVAVARLDTIVRSDAAIDLLVMDTEGFEVRAMRGAAATLRKTKYFYVEYAPEQLTEQGSKPREFIEAVAEGFSSMYIPGSPTRFFSDRSYIAYLQGLPSRKGLLLNLLFSNEQSARADLALEL